MNQYDIEEAAAQNRPGTAGRAARLLASYAEVVNSNSDGWAYWNAGRNAAKRLVALVESRREDPGELAAAERALKSFCTRRGLPHPAA